MDDLKAWADHEMDRPVASAAAPPADAAPEQPPLSITVDELLAFEDLSPEQRAWLEQYRANGPEWAAANNPPAFATDEACWADAESAAAEADDFYAFANWWYHEHCG